MLVSGIVELFHYLIVIFICSTPFVTTNRDALTIHWLALTAIIAHWLTNNSMCILTEIEHLLRSTDGKPHHRSETFVHRVLDPFFKTNDTDLDIYCIKLTLIFYILCGFKLLTM
jgi:hypothetical protein